jgi:hypothetical protein
LGNTDDDKDESEADAADLIDSATEAAGLKLARLLHDSIASLRSECAKTISESDAAIEEFKAGSTDRYDSEVQIVANRKKALELVSSSSNGSSDASDQLAKHIESIVLGSQAEEGVSRAGAGCAGASTCAGDSVVAIMRAGPCRNFRKLITIDSLSLILGQMSQCKSKADLAGFKDITFNGPRKILIELVASCRQAVKDLYSARLEFVKREATKIVKAKAEAQKKHKDADTLARAALGLDPNRSGSKNDKSAQRCSESVFAHEAALEHRIRTLAFAEVGAASESPLDFQQPFIITGVPVLDLLDKDKQIKAEVDAFRESFSQSKVRESKTRGQFRIQDEMLIRTVERKLLERLPHDSLLPIPMASMSSLARCLGIATFAIAPSSYNCAFEMACVATLRCQIEGSRSVVVSRFSKLGAFVRESGPPQARSKPLSHLAVKSWLEQVPPEKLKEFLASPGNDGAMSFGTIGPSDMLYTPAGAITTEKAGPSGDVVGFRLGFIASKDSLAVRELTHANADATAGANPMREELLRVLQTEAGASYHIHYSQPSHTSLSLRS